MVDFLLIADKNYNIQLVNAIKSLSENFDLNRFGSKIYILHKQPKSFKKYLSLLNNVSMEIVKFDKKYKVNNNIKNAHLSEVTYYRLYLDLLINFKSKFLIYFDADLYFINNIDEFIQKYLKEFENSSLEVAAVKENIINVNTIEYYKKLNLDYISYFNAGFLIFNLEECKKSNFFQKLRNQLKEINFELKYWDQDILNLVIRGNFFELSSLINFEIDLKNNNPSTIPNNVLGVHYKGKNKPWDINFFKSGLSMHYQNINLLNFDVPHVNNLLNNFFKILKLNLSIREYLKMLKLKFFI